jgi:hypothetical protein
MMMMNMKDKQYEILNLVVRLRSAPAVYVGAYCDQLLEAIEDLDQIRNVPTKPARRHLRVLDALNETGGATVEHIGGDALADLAPETVRLYLGEIRAVKLSACSALPEPVLVELGRERRLPAGETLRTRGERTMKAKTTINFTPAQLETLKSLMLSVAYASAKIRQHLENRTLPP